MMKTIVRCADIAELITKRSWPEQSQ